MGAYKIYLVVHFMSSTRCVRDVPVFSWVFFKLSYFRRVAVEPSCAAGMPLDCTLLYAEAFRALRCWMKVLLLRHQPADNRYGAMSAFELAAVHIYFHYAAFY